MDLGNQIFIQASPKKYTKNRFSFYLIVIISIFFSWIVFRGIIAADSTSSLRTENSISTIRIIKTARNTEQIHNNIGSEQVIYGSPLSFDDVLLFSKNEFSVHLDELGIIESISIDNRLSPTIKQSLQNFGLYIHEESGNTLIYSNQTAPIQENRLIIRPSFLFPFHDGELIEENNRHSISIDNEKLTIKGSGYKPERQSLLMLPKNSESISLINSINSLSGLFNNLYLNSAINSLLQGLQNNPFQISKFNLDSNSFYTIEVNDNLSTQEIAELGMQILNFGDLTTVSLTIDDGSRVSEIRSNIENVESNISSENNIDFFELINDDDDNTLSIMQTSESLRITNYKDELMLEEYQASGCCNGCHSFYSTKDDQQYLKIYNFQSLFNEIAISNKNIFLCW